jgi:hypothetical protein
LEMRAERSPFGQVDSGLQRLEHSLHRPLLPLLESVPAQVELPANFRGAAPLRPH